MKRKFWLGVITDEVSQDIFEAAAFAECHGLECLEVRSVNNHSPFDFTDEDIADIQAAAKKYGLAVSAISAPLFKCNFSDPEAVKDHVRKFETCAQRAKELGASLIRGFDFWEEGVSLEDRAKAYRQIGEICEKYGIVCVVESDPSVHSNTPSKLAQLMKAIENPCIKALYDPGNEVWVTGKASEDGYDMLKAYIAHVHIKDAEIKEGNPEAVKIGTGVVDYPAIFRKLFRDGYSGCVMLETHYRKNAELTEEQLKLPGGSGFSTGAYVASEESMIALINIINQVAEEL